MTLENGFYDVPLGKVATVETDLEMHAKIDPPDVAAPDGWQLNKIEQPDLEWYRGLIRLVGQDYLWWSRLAKSDEALAAEIHNPDVVIYALQNGDQDGGILVLDFRDPNKCEIMFFGVAPQLIGTRAARHMMSHAIKTGWSRPVKMLYLHTCTLDNPKAMSFYRRSGFVPMRQRVEIADDPRIAQILPPDAAPQIPRFDG